MTSRFTAYRMRKKAEWEAERDVLRTRIAELQTRITELEAELRVAQQARNLKPMTPKQRAEVWNLLNRNKP